MRPHRDASVVHVAAALAAFAAEARRGSESFDSVTLLRSLDESCRLLGVPGEEFDDCAKLLDYHYHRAWDCYLGRKQLAQARRLDEQMSAPRYYAPA